MPDCFCGLKIDDQFKLCWLLDGNVQRTGTAKDLHHHSRALTVQAGKAWAIADERSRFRRFGELENRRQAYDRDAFHHDAVVAGARQRKQWTCQKKLSASTPDAFAASIAEAISSGPFTPKTESATLRACAACCKAWRRKDGVPLVSNMAAIRRAPGTASIKISCRLPSSSGESRLIPVMLPPGRASEVAIPSATMSSVMPTRGIVRVAA